MFLRASATCGVSVRTIIPGWTTTVQAVWSLGVFSISTKHIRQAACNESPG